MQRQRWITLALALGLAGACGLSLFAVYGTWGAVRRAGLELGGPRESGVSAEVTRTFRFDLASPAALAIDTLAGNVDVSADPALPAGTVEVVQVATGRGADAAAARAEAEAVVVAVAEKPGEVRLTYRPDSASVLGGRHGARPRVDFRVRVAPATRVDLTTDHGTIDLAGTNGEARLTSAFGDVTAADVAGGLEAASQSGSVTAERVDAGDDDVTLESDFGAVTARDVQADAVRLGSSNGMVTAVDVRAAGEAGFESAFGDVEADGVSAERLVLTTESGAIDVRRGDVAGSITARSVFGAIALADLGGTAYTVFTQNGRIEISGAGGALTIVSSFGEIALTADAPARLDVSNDSGGITFAGPLDPIASHRVSTSFGRVELTLPAESHFDVRLETDFGRVSSDLPVTVEGAVESGSWRGRLGRGGPDLVVTTANGDIVLRALPAARAPVVPARPTDSPAPATLSTPAAAATIEPGGTPTDAAPTPSPAQDS